MSSVNDQPSITPRQDKPVENQPLDAKRREELLRLMQSWRDDDPEEQRETLKALQKALGEEGSDWGL